MHSNGGIRHGQPETRQATADPCQQIQSCQQRAERDARAPRHGQAPVLTRRGPGAAGEPKDSGETDRLAVNIERDEAADAA